MMASTLADNSSTRPCASGRKGEQKIAPFASRRRYDCKRLQLVQRSAFTVSVTRERSNRTVGIEGWCLLPMPNITQTYTIHVRFCTTQHSTMLARQPGYRRLIDPEQGGNSALRVAPGEPL